MPTTNSVIIVNKANEVNKVASTVKEEAGVNESAAENKPTVSVIVAVTDIDALSKHIGSLAAQDYANIEIIIVNNDKSDDFEAKLRRLVKKCSRKCSIKTVQFKRVHGYTFEPVSANELYLAGAEQATGDYILFTEDHIGYNSTYIAKAVQKMQNEQADLAFTDLVITWNDGVSHRYIHEIDTEGDIFGSYIKNAGKLFGLSSSETKLISRELWKKIKDDFTAHYESDENHTALCAGELILADLLWSNATKAVYVPEIFAIINWSEADTKISVYGEERKSSRIVSEINEALNFTSDICVKKNVSMVDYKEYAAEFLCRVIWRIGWINRGIKSGCEAVFGLSVPEYSLVDAFAGRIFTIDLLEYEKQSDSLYAGADMNIKIFVSMHKPSFVPEDNKYIVPIQVGTALTDERFPDMLHDDEGENISELNKMYCELTAQYWAWKNCHDADYYGFWHYRRYFSFNENERFVVTYDALNEDSLASSNIDEKHIAEVCADYDIIVSDKWICSEDDKNMTVYEHWCKHFKKDDLDIAVKVILNKYPHFYSAVMDILQADRASYCNMFIMKKEFFEEYSAFCFDVLQETESLLDQKRYNIEEYRTMGHIAERLLAFFIRYIELTRPDIDICYLGRTQYGDTRPVAEIVHPGKENCVSVMLACDDKYMKYTDVLLQSICENTSDEYFYDIVICHRNISEYNQKIAKDIFSGKSNILLRFADVTRNFEKYANVHIDRHLTYETYYRFLVLDIFKGYDRVLYLDCDMVVNTDLSKLFFTEMNGEYIAAVRDYDFIAQCVKQEEFYRKNILKYIDIDDFFNYFQAGVILFNLKTLKTKFTSQNLFNVALSRNWWFHDQDVLNCLLNGNIKYLDDRWNVFSLLDKGSDREIILNTVLAAEFAESYKRSVEEPRIIHYAGVPKVWDDTEVNLGYYFWKYARKSPYYETLLKNLIAGSSVKNDWITFIQEHDKDEGVKFFTIKTVKENWSSDYAVIDFMYLSDHNKIETDTLTISVSMLPDSSGTGRLVTKQFTWEKGVPVISDNVLFALNENNDIDIYVRFVALYTGFSFTARTLESRNLLKPSVEVANHHFVSLAEALPSKAKIAEKNMQKIK